jgi:hypothetical protein
LWKISLLSLARQGEAERFPVLCPADSGQQLARRKESLLCRQEVRFRGSSTQLISRGSEDNAFIHFVYGVRNEGGQFYFDEPIVEIECRG